MLHLNNSIAPFSIAPALAVALLLASGAATASNSVKSSDSSESSTSSSDSTAEARRQALFAEAAMLSEADRWPEAAAKIREVIAIRSSPKALVALAFAEERLDHLLEARRLLERAAEGAVAAGRLDVVQLTVDARKRLTSVTPRIRLMGPDADRIRSVEVDGLVVELVAGNFSVDPGPHDIVARADDATFEATIEIKRGSQQLVDVTLAREAEPTQATPPRVNPLTAQAQPAHDSGQADDEQPSAIPLGAVVLGVGGTMALAGGGYWYLSGRANHGDVTNQCEANGGCALDSSARYADAEERIFTGQLALGIGAASVAGGALWWFLSSGSEPGFSQETQRRDRDADVAISTAPLTGGGYVEVSGSF